MYIKKEMFEIHNCDCLSEQGLEIIPKESIDLVICDPPFGVLAREDWDRKLNLEKLFEEIERITKPNAAVIFFSQGMFSAELMTGPWKKWFRYDLIWKKNKPRGILNSKRMPLRQHENILLFYRKLPKYYPQMMGGFEPIHSCNRKNTSKHYGDAPGGKNKREGKTDRFPNSILEFSVVNKPIHPTEKPVALLEFLIKSFTEKGEVVLDMCFGSASTGEAAILNERKFVGFEKEGKFFELGKKRLENLSL